MVVAGTGDLIRITDLTPGARQVSVFFYGLFMDERLLASKEIKPSKVRLNFVEDYELRIGKRLEANCYMLPANEATGTNKAYAQSLLDIATKLRFPDSYLDEIRASRV